MLAERIDLERVLHAIGADQGLRGEIHGQRIAPGRLALREQRIDFMRGENDRQQSVLEAVVVEDIGEAGGDHRAEAVFVQRPRRVFARGAAAEVLARQQHAGAGIARGVEHEIGIERTHAVVLSWLTDVQVTPLVEEVGAEAAAFDRLQELLGDDLVGVDVGAIQRRDQAGVGGEGFHRLFLMLPSSRARRRNARPPQPRRPSPD